MSFTKQKQEEAARRRTAEMQMEMQESRSLYVGDLVAEVTESDIIHKFSTIGPLQSVRICRCISTGNSLRYAYVNFLNHIHASKALASLNHTELRGRPMRIMWCQRDPILRKCGTANLFVKNLDPSIDSAQLQGLFSQFGTVLSCKVVEENGKSKGFGFVQFDSDASAIAARTAFHDTLFRGKKLYVSKFVKRSDRAAVSDGLKFKNLYVKNLDKDVTEDLLRDRFSKYGKVCTVFIMKDQNGRSKGFGFVNFESVEEAKNAVQGLNGALLGSKTLFVGRAQKKAERAEILKREFQNKYNCNTDKFKSSNLYVKNLNGSIDDKKLHEIFGGFGRIISARVMCHADGKSKGFGFVCFSSPEEARDASNTLDGINYGGKTLYVALAQSKEDRCRKLQKHYAQKQTQSYPANSYNVPSQLCPVYSNYPTYTSRWPLVQQPILYQHSGTNVGAQYSFAAQSHPQNFSSYQNFSSCISIGQQLLQNPVGCVYRQQLMRFPTSNVGTQNVSHGHPGGQNAGFCQNGNKINGSAENSVKGTAVTVKGLAGAKSPLNSKKKTGNVLHPLQPELARRISGLLLELNNSDSVRQSQSPNSLSSEVDKKAQGVETRQML